MKKLLSALFLEPMKQLVADAADAMRADDERDRKRRNLFLAFMAYSFAILALMFVYGRNIHVGQPTPYLPSWMKHAPYVEEPLTSKQWEEKRAREGW